jgi:hypothetical protein
MSDMEKIPTSMDDKLLDYLDGKLDGSALAQLRKELEASPSLQERLDRLRAIHRVLAHTKLETPSPLFVNKVMKDLHSVSLPSSLSPRNGLLLLAGTMVAAGILIVMISAGFFDTANGVVNLDSFQEISPIKKYIQQSLPAIPINGKIVIDILVGLNLVLGFLVLDKTVLRPFFQRRAGVQL